MYLFIYLEEILISWGKRKGTISSLCKLQWTGTLIAQVPVLVNRTVDQEEDSISRFDNITAKPFNFQKWPTSVFLFTTSIKDYKN